MENMKEKLEQAVDDLKSWQDRHPDVAKVEPEAVKEVQKVVETLSKKAERRQATTQSLVFPLA